MTRWNSRGLRHVSAAALLLRLQVWILPGVQTFLLWMLCVVLVQASAEGQTLIQCPHACASVCVCFTVHDQTTEQANSKKTCSWHLQSSSIYKLLTISLNTEHRDYIIKNIESCWFTHTHSSTDYVHTNRTIILHKSHKFIFIAKKKQYKHLTK
jgi:hypothetical protein